MNGENENGNQDISGSQPEIAAIEAALAQLRPRRAARFADNVKNCVKEALSGQPSASEDPTTTVKVPLTHYIRMAQFNAAVGGLLAGLLLGVLLGGSCVAIALNRSTLSRTPPAAVYPSRLPYAWLAKDPLLTPEQRELLNQLYKESQRGRG